MTTLYLPIERSSGLPLHRQIYDATRTARAVRCEAEQVLIVSGSQAALRLMETEKAFLDTLGRVDRWRITGQQLELLDADGNVVARFEARHMS